MFQFSSSQIISLYKEEIKYGNEQSRTNIINNQKFSRTAYVLTDSAKIIKEATDEKKVIETKEEPKKEVTLIDVRTALAKLSKEGYTNDVKALLNKYGADKLSAVNPNDYESILKDAEVLNNGK